MKQTGMCVEAGDWGAINRLKDINPAGHVQVTHLNMVRLELQRSSTRNMLSVVSDSSYFWLPSALRACACACVDSGCWQCL